MNSKPSSYSLMILRALQAQSVYRGSVSAKTKKSRRAASKVARKSRRANRAA